MGWVGNEPGRGFRVAVPHPGAARHLLPILFPVPLAWCLHPFLLHCFLGKFFTQISHWNLFVFLPADLLLLVAFPWM